MRIAVLLALAVLAAGCGTQRVTLAVRADSPLADAPGVYGDLFRPRNPRPHPAVLLFGGSDGGNTMVDQAGLLAAHGYTTLSLAYFGAPGVPKHLMDIPLEYFARAARLLRAQPHVTRVVPMGVSRGGEASLLIAAKFPSLFRGAIGLVPSQQVNGSTYRFDRAAWTYRGRPLAAGTQIAVERISGPILTVGAGQDAVWESVLWVHQIETRLRDRHFRFPHTALTYPHAGHLVGVALPYVPAPAVQDEFGGSARADAEAKADLWPRILRFLARLSPPRG